MGLPFFRPLYDPRNVTRFHGRTAEGMSTEEMVSMLMTPPWFPIEFSDTPSVKEFVDLTDDPLMIEDLEVLSVQLYHPSGVTAYRFQRNGKTVVLATDVESAPWSDELLIDLASGADVLIHDGQYFPDEYRAEKVGWGHSTWEDAVRIAEAAGVGRLVLTSHDPYRTDDGVDQIVSAAASHLPTEGARTGLRIEVE